jgi:hypothetical protein
MKRIKTSEGKVVVTARLPMELVTFLRSNSGGAHTTPKGKKGYNRKAEKVRMRKESHV